MRLLNKIKGCIKSISVMLAVALCVLTGGTLSGIEKMAKGKGSNVTDGYGNAQNPAITFLAQIVTSSGSINDDNGLGMYVYVDAYGNATTQTIYTDGAGRYFDTFVDADIYVLDGLSDEEKDDIEDAYKNAVANGSTNVVYDEAEPLPNADLNFNPIYYNGSTGYYSDETAYLKPVTPSGATAVDESRAFDNGTLYAYTRSASDDGIYTASKIYQYKVGDELKAFYGDVEGSAVLIVDFNSYIVDDTDTLDVESTTYYAYTNGVQTYYVTVDDVTEEIFANSLVLYTLSDGSIEKYVDLSFSSLQVKTQTAEFTELYAPAVFDVTSSDGYTAKIATTYIDDIPAPGYYQVYKNVGGDVIYKDYQNLNNEGEYYYSFQSGQWAKFSPTLTPGYNAVYETREVSFISETTTTDSVYRINGEYYTLTYSLDGTIQSIAKFAGTPERQPQTARIMVRGTAQTCHVYKYLNTYYGVSLTIYSPVGTSEGKEFFNGNGDVFHGDTEFFSKQYENSSHTLTFTVYEKTGEEEIYTLGNSDFYSIATDADYGANGVYEVYEKGTTNYYYDGASYYEFVERSYYNNFINQNIEHQAYNKGDAVSSVPANLTAYGFNAEGVQVLHYNGIPTYHTDYFDLLYLSRTSNDPLGQNTVYTQTINGATSYYFDRMFYNSSSMTYNVAKATYKLNDGSSSLGLGYERTTHERVKAVEGESQDKNEENYGASIDSQNVLGTGNYNIISTLNNGDTYLLKDKGVSNVEKYSLRISLSEFGLPIVNSKHAQIIVRRDGEAINTTDVASLGTVYSHTDDGETYFNTNATGGTAVNNGSDYAYGAIVEIPYADLESGRYEIVVQSSVTGQSILYLAEDGSHLSVDPFKINFTIVKEKEYFTDLIVPTLQNATQNTEETSKILYYNLTAVDEGDVARLTFDPSKFALLISHSYSTSVVNYEIKQTDNNTIRFTKATFNAIGQQIGSTLTKNLSTNDVLIETELEDDDGEFLYDSEGNVLTANTLTLELEKLGQYTIKYYPLVGYAPLKLDNYEPKWEGATSEGFSGVNDNSANFDQMMLKVFGFETYYSPNNTGTDEFYRLKDVQNLDNFFNGRTAYTGTTVNANVTSQVSVPTIETATSIFNNLENVVSTNQPTVSFKSSAYLLATSYYLFRPFNSSVWSKYNYYSNTRFSNPGDYMVVLNFTDAMVNGAGSQFNTQQHTQVFAFSVKMTNPSFDFVEVDTDGNEISGGKDIEDLTYTNHSVKLKVSQDSIFDSKPLVYAYQSRTDYLRSNGWFDYGTTPSLLNLKESGEGYIYHIFNESRAYMVEVVYGPSSLVDQSTSMSAEFVIDKNPLQIVPSQTKNGVTKAITSDTVEAISGSFSIEYVAKLSGAKLVKAEYSFTELIGDYTPNASVSSIVTTDEGKQIILNGLSLDFANKQTGLAYATSEAGEGYGRTFSTSGLYEFYFEDEAGNVNKYYIMLDNVSPSYLIKEYDAATDTTLESAYSEVVWGDYKGIRAGNSEITLEKTSLSGNVLTMFNSTLFTNVSGSYYYTAEIAPAGASAASTYVTFKTSGNPSYITSSSSFATSQLTDEALAAGISVYRDLTASGFKALATKRNEGVFVFQVADKFGNQTNASQFSFNFDLSQTTTYALNEDINLAKYGNALQMAFGANEYNTTNFDYLAITSKVDGSAQYTVESITVDFYSLTADGYASEASKSQTIYSKTEGFDIRWDGVKIDFASYALMLVNGLSDEGKYVVTRTYDENFVAPNDLFEKGVTTDVNNRTWASFVDRAKLFDEVNEIKVGENSNLTLGSEGKEFTNFIFGEDANVKISLETNLAPILINIVENKFGVAIENANGEQLDSFKFKIRLRGIYNGRTWLDTDYEKLAMVYNEGFISLGDLIGSVYEAQDLGKNEGLIYESTYILDVYDGANSFITGFNEKPNSVAVKFVIKSNKPDASVNRVGEEEIVYFKASTLNSLVQSYQTSEPGINYLSYVDGEGNKYYKLNDTFYTYNAVTKSLTVENVNESSLTENYETRVIEGNAYDVYLTAGDLRYLYAGDVYRISPSGIRYNDGKASVSYEAGSEEYALVDTTVYYDNDGYSEVVSSEFIDIQVYETTTGGSALVKIYNNYYTNESGVYVNQGTTLPDGYTLSYESSIVYNLAVNKEGGNNLLIIDNKYYSLENEILTNVSENLDNYIALRQAYSVYEADGKADLYLLYNKYYSLNGALEYVADELPTGYEAKQTTRMITVGDENIEFTVFESATGVEYYLGDPGSGYNGLGYYTYSSGVLTYVADYVEGELPEGYTPKQVAGTFAITLYEDASSNRRFGVATSAGLAVYIIAEDKFVEIDRVYRPNGTNAYFTLGAGGYVAAEEGSYNFTGFTYKMEYKADSYNLQTGEPYFEILEKTYEAISWDALNITQFSEIANIVNVDGYTRKQQEETLELIYTIYELKGDESVVIYEMGGNYYALPNGDLTSPLEDIDINDYSTIGKTVVVNGIEYDVKTTSDNSRTFYIDGSTYYLYSNGRLIRVVVDDSKTEGESGKITSYSVPVVYQDNETIDTILISAQTDEDIAAVLKDALDEYQAKIDFATSTINGVSLSETFKIDTDSETVYNILVSFKGNPHDFNYTFNYGMEGRDVTVNGFTTQIVLAIDSTKPNSNIDRLYNGEFEINYHYVSDEEYVDFSFRTDEETANNASAILDEYYFEGYNIRDLLTSHFEGKDFALSAYSASRYPSLYNNGSFILSTSEVDGIIYFSFDFNNPNFTNDRLYAFAKESGVLTVRSITYTDNFLKTYMADNSLDYNAVKESGALKDYVFTVDQNHVFERSVTSGNDAMDNSVSSALGTSQYTYRLDTSRIFIRAVPTSVTSVGTDWSKPSDLPDEESYTSNNNRPKFALTSPSYIEISYGLTLGENLNVIGTDFSGYSIFEIIEIDGAGNYRSYFICYKPYANETEISAKYQNYFNNIGNATIGNTLYNKQSNVTDGTVINSANLETFEITSLIASNEWFTVKVYRNDGEKGVNLVSTIYNKYIEENSGVFTSNTRTLSELNALVKEAISPNGSSYEGRQFTIVILDRYTRQEINVTVNFATIEALKFSKQVSPDGVEIVVSAPETTSGGLANGTQIQSLTVTEFSARTNTGSVRITDANGKSITTQKGEQYTFSANNNKSLYLFSYYDNFGRLINESFSTAVEEHAFYTNYALTNKVEGDNASGTVLFFAYQTLYYTNVSFSYKDAGSDVSMVVMPSLTNLLDTGVRICRFDLPFGVDREYTAVLTDRASASSSYSARAYKILPELNFASNDVDLTGNFITISQTDDKITRELITPVTNMTINLIDDGVQFNPTVKAVIVRNTTTETRNNIFASGVTITYSANGRYQIIISNTIGTVIEYIFNIADENAIVYTIQDSRTKQTLNAGLTLFDQYGYTGRQYYTTDTNFILTTAKTKGVNVVNGDMTLSTSLLTDNYATYAVISGTIDNNNNPYYIFHIYASGTGSAFAYDEYIKVTVVDISTNNDVLNLDGYGADAGEIVTTSDDFSLTYNTNPTGNYYYAEIYYRSPNNLAYVKLPSTNGSSYNTTNTLTFSEAGTYYVQFKDIAGNVFVFNSQPYLKVVVLTEIMANVSASGILNSYNDYAIDGVVVEGGNVTVAVENADKFVDNSVTTLETTVTKNGISYTVENPATFVLNGVGVYDIAISGKYNNLAISNAFRVIVVNPNEARLGLEYLVNTNVEILSVTRGTLTSEGNDITDQLSSKNLLNISNNSLGDGLYTVTVNATFNSEFRSDTTFTFSVFISNASPLIQCNQTLGETTTKVIEITYNPSVIYATQANCRLEITGFDPIIIDANNKDDNTFHKVVIEDAGKYDIKLYSESGQSLFYWTSITKKDPLNGVAILLIVIGSLIGVGLIVAFILLRTRMRVR